MNIFVDRRGSGAELIPRNSNLSSIMNINVDVLTHVSYRELIMGYYTHKKFNYRFVSKTTTNDSMNIVDLKELLLFPLTFYLFVLFRFTYGIS